MKFLGLRLPWRAEDGTSAIEFAFTAGILVVLLLGLTDFAIGYWDKMEIANGARAGAEYAVNKGYTSQSDVQSAATNATSRGVTIQNFTATASELCGCPDPTSGITASSGTPPTCTSGTCTNGSPGTYVKVVTAGSYTPIFPWPGLPSTFNFSSTAIVRIN